MFVSIVSEGDGSRSEPPRTAVIPKNVEAVKQSSLQLSQGCTRKHATTLGYVRTVDKFCNYILNLILTKLWCYRNCFRLTVKMALTVVKECWGVIPANVVIFFGDEAHFIYLVVLTNKDALVVSDSHS